MATLVGAFVESITIDPDWDDSPERYADTRIGWPVDNFSERELQEKMILVALAGPVAEMLHTGDPYHPGLVAEWANDWRQAENAAEKILDGKQKQYAHLEQKTIELYHLLDQNHYWAAIAAIVDNLLAHETMQREQVEEILQIWL